MFRRGWSKRAWLGVVVGLAIPALTIGLAATPAYADGGSTGSVPPFVATTAGGTVYTCGASVHADWEIYPDFGDAAVFNITGTTTCSPFVPKMTGSLALTRTGDATPVRTAAFSKLNATLGVADGSSIAALPGENYTLAFTTTVRAPIGATWTTVPSGCTATPVPPTPQNITCTVIINFTVA